jgi:hypothetical protein
MYNPYAFISTDIVAWNGLIVSFGSISFMVSEEDSLRIANEEEEKAYKSAPERSPYLLN